MRGEVRLDGLEIRLGVHPDGGLRGFEDLDRDAVLEETELLEPLGGLKR